MKMLADLMTTPLKSGSYIVLIQKLCYTVGLTRTVDRNCSASVLQKQCVKLELLKSLPSRKSTEY